MQAITSPLAMLRHYRQEAMAELKSILDWWCTHMPDTEQGGFFGTVDNYNQPGTAAEKGVVLNSRILWTFSAASRLSRKPAHLNMATSAFDYLSRYFTDAEYGGLFWSVSAAGAMLNGRKQIYGLAFGIYGFAEYYKTTRNENALRQAVDLYRLIERHSYDSAAGGYLEAFDRNWQPLEDMRLSGKDDNEKKTMNTHLHIAEAYATLYRVWPDAGLKKQLEGLLYVFDRYIINHQNHHLHLFMNEAWQVRSGLISYGHDIEAAWLLQECAEAIQHAEYETLFKTHAVQMAAATAAEGLDADGGLWYEYDPATQHLIREKHSWPQAEAMVGFLNAYQLTGNAAWLQHSLSSFAFINRCIKDHRHGEWYWGVEAGGAVMAKEKAGFWKCPYHNSRACMEVVRRTGLLIQSLS